MNPEDILDNHCRINNPSPGSGSHSQSEKDSQESVICLGEYTSSGECLANNGEEDIMDIADELSRNMDVTEYVSSKSAARLKTTEIIRTPVTQQPVWDISIVPLSASPARIPLPGISTRSMHVTPEIANTNDQQTEQVARSSEAPQEEIQQVRIDSNCNVVDASSTDIIARPAVSICQTPVSSRNKRRTFQRNATRSPEKRQKAGDGRAVSPHSVSSSVAGSLASLDDVDAVEAETNAHIVSIHKICVETAKKAFGKKAENDSEFQIIEKIVNKANNKVKDAQVGGSRSKSSFQRREDFHMPTLSDEQSRLLFSGEDFQCEIYVQEVTSYNNFLLGYSLRENENTINSIVFYYRQGDIFALTTRHAWNAIQWCSDFDFPPVIAARLLNPEGQLKCTDKELVGNVRVTAKTRKTCEGDNPLDINRISTHYVTDFRKNCSIFKFTCFQNADPNVKENVKVEVGFGYIRILKRLSPSEFLLTLSHLSLVHKGEITYILNTEDIEKDSKTHSKNLTMVSNELSRKLDSTLIKKIYNAVHNSGKAELENFDFFHKDVEDYSLADNFHMCIGKERVSSFPSHPTLKKIIDFMMRSEIISFKNLINAKTFADFEKKFSKFKIGYSVRGRDKPPEKILNFVEGDLIHTDNRLYCRYITKWCDPAPGYFAMVHFYFQDILKKHLINADNFPRMQLAKLWPSKAEIRRQKKKDEDYAVIQEYVNSYREEENCYIPQCDSLIALDDVGNTKLFDMMMIGDHGEIYIYIIQDGFSAKIRHAASQIKKTLNKLNTSSFGNTNTPTQSQSDSDSFCDFNNMDPLKEFYELCCDDNLFCQRFPDLHIFKSELKNANIVFSIADPPEDARDGRNTIDSYFQSTSTNAPPLIRSFSKEKDLPTKLSIAELSDLLQGQQYFDDSQLDEFLGIYDIPCGTANRSKVFAVASKLYDIFRKLKYVDRDGKVTSKMLLSSDKRFEIKGLENHDTLKEAIYSIVKSHKSQYKYLIPKLALVNIKNEIVQAGYKFNICQIPVADSD